MVAVLLAYRRAYSSDGRLVLPADGKGRP